MSIVKYRGFDAIYQAVRRRCLLYADPDELGDEKQKARAMSAMVASCPYSVVSLEQGIYAYCQALQRRRLEFADAVDKCQRAFPAAADEPDAKDSFGMPPPPSGVVFGKSRIEFPGDDDPRIVSEFVRSALIDRQRLADLTAELKEDDPSKVHSLSEKVSDVAMNMFVPVVLALGVTDELKLAPMNIETCFESWVSERLATLATDIRIRRVRPIGPNGVRTPIVKMESEVSEFLFVMAEMAYFRDHEPVSSPGALLERAKKFAAAKALDLWTGHFYPPVSDRALRFFRAMAKYTTATGKWFDHNDAPTRGRVVAAFERGEDLKDVLVHKQTAFAAKELAEVLDGFLEGSLVILTEKPVQPQRSRVDAGSTEYEVGAEEEKRPSAVAGFGIERRDALSASSSADYRAVLEGPKTNADPKQPTRESMTLRSYREHFANARVDVSFIYHAARRLIWPDLERGKPQLAVFSLFDELKSCIANERLIQEDLKTRPVRTNEVPFKGLYWRTSQLTRTLRVLRLVYEEIAADAAAVRTHTPTRWVCGTDPKDPRRFISTWPKFPEEHKKSTIGFVAKAISDIELVLFSQRPLDKIELAKGGYGYINDLLALMPLSPESSNPVESAMRMAPSARDRYSEKCSSEVNNLRQQLADVLEKRADCESLLRSKLTTHSEQRSDSLGRTLPEALGTEDESVPMMKVPLSSKERSETTKDIQSSKRHKPAQPFWSHQVGTDWTARVTIPEAMAYIGESAAPMFASEAIATAYWYQSTRFIAKSTVDWMMTELHYRSFTIPSKKPAVNFGTQHAEHLVKSLASFSSGFEEGVQRELLNRTVHGRGIPITSVRRFIDDQDSKGKGRGNSLSFLVTRCAACYAELAYEHSKALFPGMPTGLIDARVFSAVFKHFLESVVVRWQMHTAEVATYLSGLVYAGFEECKETMRSLDKRSDLIAKLRTVMNRDVYTNSANLLRSGSSNRPLVMLTRALRGLDATDVSVPGPICVLLTIAAFPWISEPFLSLPAPINTGVVRSMLDRSLFFAIHG